MAVRQFPAEGNMAMRAFHQAIIGRLRLEGLLSADGPYVQACDLASRQPVGGVALGVSRLRHFQPEPIWHQHPALGWWVVKYANEARIHLPGFGVAEVERLRAEFGLASVEAGAGLHDSVAGFYCSQAWAGLVRWVAEHPRSAKRMAGCDAYLPGWHDLAQAAQHAAPAEHH